MRGCGRGLDLAQPFALDEAARHGRWGIRRGREAVPAPHIALARDEDLSRPQRGPQLNARAPLDDAGLIEAPLEGGGRFDEIGELQRRRRQGGVAIRLDQSPMRGRRGVGRGFEILAEGRAERRLIAFPRRHLVEDGREFGVGRGHELAQGALRLGVEPLRLALGRPRTERDCAPAPRGPPHGPRARRGPWPRTRRTPRSPRRRRRARPRGRRAAPPRPRAARPGRARA